MKQIYAKCLVCLAYVGVQVLTHHAIAAEPQRQQASENNRKQETLDHADSEATPGGTPVTSRQLTEAESLVQQEGHEIAQARSRGLVSVLVYLESPATLGIDRRPSIREFARNNLGKVKYEYGAVLPHVMNLRNIPAEKLDVLRQMPGVTKVEPDKYHPNLVTLHDSTPLIGGLQSQVTAAGYEVTGEGVRVCVIDTGIDTDHIMYADRIDTSAGWNFVSNNPNPEDDQGHGSHVAGIAVGGTGIETDPCGTGAVPFQGVAPSATLIGVKALNLFGGAFDSDIVAAINHCADQSESGGRADVINLSFGQGEYPEGNCTHIWADAANNAAASGVVVVAASGNNGFDNALLSPACASDVMAIGATYKSDLPICEDATADGDWGVCVDPSPQADDVTCFSNDSDFLDVTAPGTWIMSADNVSGGNSFIAKSGTSMSSPMVAGMAALILQKNPALTPAEVRQVIRDGAIDLGPAGFDRAYGWGRIDVINSLALAGPSCNSDTECDDGNACTDDACIDATCQNVVNNSNPCDDGLFCTAIDSCSGGVCVGSGDPCAEGLFCIESTDSCLEADCVVDTDCNDGDECTVDSCSDGSCQNACPSHVFELPYADDFEGGFGDWINVSGDQFDWTHDSGGTPSGGTGPNGDHTTGAGYYMYTETSGPLAPGNSAILEGPCIDLSAEVIASLRFWYHMYGSGVGSLDVEISTDCATWTNVWSLSGYQGSSWYEGEVDLAAYAGSTVTIRFIGTRGSNWLSDIAIDDVSVSASNGCLDDSECDDGAWCNGAETCVGGVCQAGTAVDCDDGIDCTVDACNEDSDSCDNIASNAYCDDGDFCNGAETCDPASGCQVGLTMVCDDGNDCTDDACVAGTCQHTPNDANTCDDGLYCTGLDFCGGGTCVGSGDPCPSGLTCNEDTDSCIDAGCVVDTDCDDGHECTTDTCTDGACTSACATHVSSYPYLEDLEDGFGEWINVDGDDFNWTHDSGNTPSGGTGPNGDHTPGGQWFVYTETSGRIKTGDRAELEGPCFDLTGASSADLSFWYHMYGSGIGTLDVEVSTDCSTWTNVWSLSGWQGAIWYEGAVDLSAYAGSTITIRFVGTKGINWLSDIAIDDITVDADP
ncbi:MAG: S8 family serine peptidase [Planctomycetota bacterium]|jgi:subtilisin family serine protease